MESRSSLHEGRRNSSTFLFLFLTLMLLVLPYSYAIENYTQTGQNQFQLGRGIFNDVSILDNTCNTGDIDCVPRNIEDPPIVLLLKMVRFVSRM